MSPEQSAGAGKICFHCGEPVTSPGIRSAEKYFCCNGCKQVFLLLNESNLYSYYDLNPAPGKTAREPGNKSRFAYLEDPTVIDRLTLRSEGDLTTAIFKIPSIHCSSCVYVLEKLYKLEPGIKSSGVDFLRKEVSLKYAASETSLRKVVELLASIGYEPQIDTADAKNTIRSDSRRDLYIKIGIAGFAFGNIMLLSLPDYLAIRNPVDPPLQTLFRVLSLLLALPVLLVSARGYFKSALTGLRQGLINIDFPVSLGILSLFGRSVYEIFTGAGAGYMDSFVALVFLLLLGKLFQEKSYATLSFERDFRSYFPVSVIKKTPEGEVNIPLSKLKIGDRILIRNGEIIPADSILIRSDTRIDYSFVTGESNPVKKTAGELLYAGGRQVGGAIEVDVVKPVSQSYLTRLWNKDLYRKHQKSHLLSLTDRVSRNFTAGVVLIALAAGFYWLWQDFPRAVNAFTAVLIVACPCALALSAPFTLGTAMRVMGKNQFYLKNVNVIEALERIDTIIFDKTGTLTYSGKSAVRFIPAAGQKELTPPEQKRVRSLVRHSSHPLSQSLYGWLSGADLLEVRDYREVPGQGIEGFIEGHHVKVGSAEFTGAAQKVTAGSSVWIAQDDKCRGYFRFSNEYREGLGTTLERLSKNYTIALLSGDNDRERESLLRYFTAEDLHFDQSPFDKLKFISEKQRSGARVLMIGDGLNDAGSLKQSDVGVSISEDKNAFSPACDGILAAGEFAELPDFLLLSKDAGRIIRMSFLISFLYNSIGIGFAVTGNLSPLISAVLMPVSSVSVVAFSTLVTRFSGRRRGLLI
ncbi:MAG: HAD-IC family P-type ATPase [FCB group bacterium]|nr:HAD-IC family P-type ATPase [FCB group bacterium]